MNTYIFVFQQNKTEFIFCIQSIFCNYVLPALGYMSDSKYPLVYKTLLSILADSYNDGVNMGSLLLLISFG